MYIENNNSKRRNFNWLGALLVIWSVASLVRCTNENVDENANGKNRQKARAELFQLLKSEGFLNLLQGMGGGNNFNQQLPNRFMQPPPNQQQFVTNQFQQQAPLPPPQFAPPPPQFNPQGGGGNNFIPSDRQQPSRVSSVARGVNINNNDRSSDKQQPQQQQSTDLSEARESTFPSAIEFAPEINPFDPRFNNCGIPRVVNFVANGQDAVDNEWPWHVQLIIISHEFGESETFCGATIVSPFHALTASHCYDDMAEEVMAENTRIIFRGLGFGKKPFEARAHRVIKHPEYIPAMTEFEARIQEVKPGPLNDLALIVLRRLPDDILRRIVPACLPSKFMQLPLGTVCKVMGHGFMNGVDEANFRMPSQMQIADVAISRNQDCRDDVESPSIKEKINERTTCIRGPIQPCVGDSGGPLVCTGESPTHINGARFDHLSDDRIMDPNFNGRRYYLVGITSFAVSTDHHDKCGQFKSAVFTLTSAHNQWIRKKMLDRSLLPPSFSTSNQRPFF